MVNDFTKDIIRSHPFEGRILLNQGYHRCVLDGIGS
jgi:hypothetical protein